MDRNTITSYFESSSYSIPGALADITLNSTPVPKATSTASQRKFPFDKYFDLEELKLMPPSATLKSELQPSTTFPSKCANAELSMFHRDPSNWECDESRPTALSSSLDSSLGIIPNNIIDGVPYQPLTGFSERDKLDLTERLAKQLTLQTHTSTTTGSAESQDPKMVSSFVNEENKENQMRDSSNRYSSLNSAVPESLNNTVEESLAVLGKQCHEGRTLKKEPLQDKQTGMNNIFENFSTNASWSIFENGSQLSMSGEQFQSGLDAAERLRQDEAGWHSRSGICHNTGQDFSIRTQDGDKLSITSFMRQRSEPLGSLQSTVAEGLRPAFGWPILSPVRPPPRPILSPPTSPPSREKEELGKVPLLEDEVPTQDNETNVSVPSLSCIRDVLGEARSTLTPRQMIDMIMASSKYRKQVPSTKRQKQDKVTDNRLAERETSQCIPQDGLKKTITSFVEAGSNSFCHGGDPSRLGMSLIDQTAEVNEVSMESSVLNITNIDGIVEDYVCVLSPESMDFDITNQHSTEQHFSISKSCYVGGRRQDSAAMIHIPCVSLTIQPGQNKIVSVTVAAICEGSITIKLEVTRTDSVTGEKEVNFVTGKILAEIPKLTVVNRWAEDMAPIAGTHGTEHMAEVELRNNGRATCPLQLTITQESHNDIDLFCFCEGNNQSLDFRLEPGQVKKLVIKCVTPSIFEAAEQSGNNIVKTQKNQLKCTAVTARTDISLSVAAAGRLPPLASVVLKARLKSNFLCAPSSLPVPPGVPVPLRLVNSSPLAVPLEALVTSEFDIQPSQLTIQPRHTVTLLVTCRSKLPKKGFLYLDAAETNSSHSFSVILNGDIPFSSSNSCLVSAQSSRATSPASSTRSSAPSVHTERLRLMCSKAHLVWGACSLQQKVIKTCYLKNSSAQREKLLLRINDSHGCFKLMTETGAGHEMRLSLEPYERVKLSVMAVASCEGPLWGRLTIARVNDPHSKRQLSLSAFGGKARVSVANGLFEGPDRQKWLYLNPDTLITSFTLLNMGESTAFLKISQDLITLFNEGLRIVPTLEVVAPGQSITIQLSFSPSTELLGHLLGACEQTAVCVAQLVVTHGDESSRQRLCRLSAADDSLASKVASLTLPLARQIDNLDKLDSIQQGASETLWTDVGQWQVSVMAQRSALQALALDASIDFFELNSC